MARSELLHSAGLGLQRGVNSTPKATDPQPMTDAASVLMSEVATSDVSKLANILDPASDANSSQILDSLLYRAVQEVAKGNAERAVGYLADYATRDPGRAESLPLQPELESVRDKIDSMVSRMAEVAKMSAEDGLSRAEQTASANAGKLSDWDTHADVLLKLAHRIFEAGGYANYSRTSNLARAVTDAVPQTKHAPQALAASAAASAGMQTNQMLPGINVPYWASPDTVVLRSSEDSRAVITAPKNTAPTLHDFEEVAGGLSRHMWARAPLLVLLVGWFFVGLGGGVAFFVVTRIWPDALFAAMGDFVFQLWGLGLLALVCVGFYMRVRYRR